MVRHMRKNTVSDFFGSGVFGLLGSFPIPQHCKFFAGYASSGRFDVLRFNACINDDIMLIEC